jgi:DNA-binding transcriptional MocR family regulator
MLQYGADQGNAYFRRALAEFLGRRYETPVNPDALLVTASASQALDLICTRFTKPGDTIFVEEPTYFLALITFRDHGLNVVGIPIDEDGLRMDVLEDALSRHRPVFLYTIPTFQNPSGVTLSAPRREQLKTLSQQHDFLVVADEVYHLLDFGDSPPLPLSHGDSGRVLSLGSFSKICAPGLRLGWVQAHEMHLESLTQSGLVESGGGLNPFTSAIMRSMLEMGFEDQTLNHLKSAYQHRSAELCDALCRYLPTAAFVEPRGGFFVWVQLPGNRAAADVLVDARKLGVGFQAGSRFGNSSTLARYARLSFAHYESPDLVEGVRRLAVAAGG